jgi:hypothetical protein
MVINFSKIEACRNLKKFLVDNNITTRNFISYNIEEEDDNIKFLIHGNNLNINNIIKKIRTNIIDLEFVSKISTKNNRTFILIFK